MPADYGLLTQGQPQFNPQLANMGGAITQGMDANNLNQYRGALTQSQQQDNQLKQLSTIQNLAGALHFNPTQSNLDATKQMLNTMGMSNYSGMLPDKIEDAKPMIESAYRSSGMALNYMQAQGLLNYRTSFMDRNEAEANKADWSMGANSGGGSTGQMGGTSPTQQGGGTTTPTTGNGQPNTSMMTPSGEPVPQQLQQYLNKPVDNSPAGMAQKTAQAEEWIKYKEGMAHAAQAATTGLPFIQDARTQIQNLGDKLQGPAVGMASRYSDAGIRLGKDSAAMQFDVLRSLTGIGNRVMKFEGDLTDKSTPSTRSDIATNMSIVNKAETVNRFGQLGTQALSKLEQYGINNHLDAQNILNKVYDTMGVEDNKGNVDPKQVRNFWNAFQKVTGVGLKGNYKMPNGSVKTADQINTIASASNIAPEDVINRFNLSPEQDMQTLPMNDKQVQRLKTLFGKQ